MNPHYSWVYLTIKCCIVLNDHAWSVWGRKELLSVLIYPHVSKVMRYGAFANEIFCQKCRFGMRIKIRKLYLPYRRAATRQNWKDQASNQNHIKASNLRGNRMCSGGGNPSTSSSRVLWGLGAGMGAGTGNGVCNQGLCGLWAMQRHLAALDLLESVQHVRLCEFRLWVSSWCREAVFPQEGIDVFMFQLWGKRGKYVRSEETTERWPFLALSGYVLNWCW